MIRAAGTAVLAVFAVLPACFGVAGASKGSRS
jgi:hypothetical protein